MEKTTPEGNKLTGIFCQIFGHHYTVSKRVTKHIKEYKCLHCQKQVTTDERGKLSVLTPKMRDIKKNSSLRSIKAIPSLRGNWNFSVVSSN